MTSTLPRLDGPADAELISAVRGGDIDAYGELFARHADAARRLARQLVSSGDADDLVSDAFAKVLGVLQRGGGPDVAFRAYLLTSVRSLHVDRIRANSRLTTTDDLTPFDPGVPFQDTAVEGFENEAAARAFASLPERWQLVLWHLEVEGQKPADIAPLLGMSANSVSALAYRAREGLRQAFLNQHAQELEEDGCRWTHQHLGAYIRNGISRRDAGKVEEHLDDCRKCMAIYLELSEVNSNLSGILAPLLLGSAATAYVAAAGGAIAKGGLVLLIDRAKDFVATNAAGTAVAGVAVTAVIAGTAFLAINHNDDQQITSADQQPGAPTVQVSPGDSGDRGDGATNPRNGGASPGPSQIAPSSSPDAFVPPSSDSTPSESPADEPSGSTDEPSGSDEPSPSESESPTPSNTEEPSPSNTESPSPSNTTSPSPSDGDVVIDGSVFAEAAPQGATRFSITTRVLGYAQGSTGTLEVSASRLAFLTDVGGPGGPASRCTVTSPSEAVCPLSGLDPEFFYWIAEPDGTGTASITFTVQPTGTTVDTDDTNDTTTVVLNPRGDRIAPRGVTRRA